MRSGRTTFFLIFIIVLAAIVPVEARTAFRYDTAQRVIKACVPGIADQTADNHPNPYIIEALRRATLTPDDWVFENPLARGTVVEGLPTAVKGTRDYWFVNLDMTDPSRLIGMDLIYLADDGEALSEIQQDGLLAAVEAGALLWVDGLHDGTFSLGPFEVNYGSGGDSGFTRAAYWPEDGFAPYRHHGMLRHPHALDDGEIARLGDIVREEDGWWDVPGNFVEDTSGHFTPVIETGTVDAGDVVNREPFTLVAEYGSGAIVVTTGGVGSAVSAWLQENGGRRGAPDQLQAPDVKLALNMIQWRDRWQQARGRARAGATSISRAPAPLDIAWQFPDEFDEEHIGAVVSTPVYDGGMVYAVTLPHDGANSQLLWFDVEPEQDLSRDPDTVAPADDGILDYAHGARYDMVHRVSLGNGGMDITPRFASPTLATLQHDGGDRVVLVSYVDTGNGVGYVDCYDASIQEEAPTRLWRREIPGYDGAEVVALSTPVVHNGFVYLLATEFDGSLSFGRVHCFELAHDWTGDTWSDNGAWWVYPSDEPDIDGSGTGPAGRELPGLLPPFHEPLWVEEGPGRLPLPPAPGPMPVVHSAIIGIDGVRVDAAITFGTPVTHRWAEDSIGIDEGVAGSQFTLIPAPMRRADAEPYLLNRDYHLVRTNRTIDLYSLTTLARDPDIEQPEGEQLDADYVRYDPGLVREAIVEAVGDGMNPLAAQLGVDVIVHYQSGGEDYEEEHRVSGPVLWRRTFTGGREITQPAGMTLDEVMVSASIPATGPPADAGGSISSLDATSGEVKWSYNPVANVPHAAEAISTGITAPAIDRETAVVGSTAEDAEGRTASSVIGLQRQIDASITLIAPEGYDEPAAVRLAGPDMRIARSYYRYDPHAGRLVFPGATAGEVRGPAGQPLGPIYGRAIRIEWDGDLVEDRVIPPIERFHHVYGFIRLRNYPVDWGSPVEIRRPDGRLIEGYDAVTPEFPFGAPDNQRAACSLDGWIDMRNAEDEDGVSVRPGDEVLVSYVGWIEGEGWVQIPDDDLNLQLEAHQMAMEFGPPNAPAMAGNSIHMGTEGLFDQDADAYDAPEGEQRRATDTLLSLMWNRATGFVASTLSTPARPQEGVDGVPVVSSAPAVAADRVFVGSRMKTEPYPGEAGYGYISALRPWRVLIADTNRIVETAGSRPSWVATGTTSPQRGQSFIGEDLRRPFNRPAKATRLPSGNILVVDTGNHRVVEIDRGGRIVWPLDRDGYDYYTSPENRNLKLSRPTDAHRYLGYEDGHQVMHTVIADAGNARVIRVTTRLWDEDDDAGYGRQRHTVRTVTPAYIRMGGERGDQRARYTSAHPIRDPNNNEVVGYLCAAANLNQLVVVAIGETARERRANPFAREQVGGGTDEATWAQWAWLYDHAEEEPPEGERRYVSNEPLQFENIRDVDVQRHGNAIYVTVTAGGYLGRARFHYCHRSDCLERASAEHYNVGDICPDCDQGELRAHHRMSNAGAGVFQFQIDVSDLDNPATWRLVETHSPDQPHWYFVRRYQTPGAGPREDYSGPMTEIRYEDETLEKDWYPVSARRLPDGRHLIVNGLSYTESLTHENVDSPEAVLGPHIFEITTENTGDGNPHTDAHSLNPERSVPAPGESWADPFTQPAHAEISG